MSKASSFLRWAGSKKKLIPTLRQYWGNGYPRYIEPFMGSAQLFFYISPQEALLSDLNSELIEVFEKVKKDPYPIYKILAGLEISEVNYYKIRALNPKSLGSNQRAARFIFLNRLCFNGLYRTNNKGEFNVPFCKTIPHSIGDYDQLKKISKKLESVKIVHGDFERVIIENVKENDFVYLDPPYAASNRRIFNQYGPQTFGLNDLVRTKEVLRHIESKKAYFLLSYAHCKEAVETFKDWPLRKTYTQRNISGFAQYRKKAAELLVSNIILNER